MRTDRAAMRRGWLWIVLGLGACGGFLGPATATRGDDRGRAQDRWAREYHEARALFERLWEPTPDGGSGPTTADGLGPLYNEQSCVGCHHQGGTGGAGDNSRNVTILAVVPGVAVDGRAIFLGELADLHPGLRNRTSVVLHRRATATADRDRLARMAQPAFVQTRDDLFGIARSERSTPALFGAGKLDGIADADLLAAEARRRPDFPEITGRVSRLRNGQLGRFGWKGQTAHLADFVRAACANELGLEVRGQHQPSLVAPEDYDPQAQALDLTDEQVGQLIQFVADLPAPAVRPSLAAIDGAALFESVGCVACHVPSLGRVRGLYSDLLLHDLGERIQAAGSGYGGPPPTIVERPARTTPDAPPPAGEAGPTEWRTPPLWGVAASAPYLHDGRAATLHDAILFHGGEADRTTRRYLALAASGRASLLAFLRAQVAPPQPGRPTPSGKRPLRAARP